MKYQEKSYSCGAAVVLNAARCFGKRIPERIIRSIAETTSDEGTQEDGIVRALGILGLTAHAFTIPDFDLALEQIRLGLVTGNPTILCTWNLQHWVLVIGATDNFTRYIIIDSSNSKRNKKENGVRILLTSELRRSWQMRKGGFYGINIRRKMRKKHT
jgi:ABC-type bacteriocin/lantibiotic exporter with double-glycine peptidase domain